MLLTTCNTCGSPYQGPVCPRCAIRNVRRFSLETDVPDGTPIDPLLPEAGGSCISDASQDLLVPGAMLGHFQIVNCLGEGGMSRVYEAFDTMLTRKVAIKVPKAEILRNPSLCEWFTQEGQSIARISEPHIVHIHHSEEFDGLPCHVMEFIEGENLATRIAREGRIVPDEAAAIGRDIALGLLEIHVHGRIHGDIKPANIIVGRDHATIVDFGLSRVLASGNPDARASSGTPEYMSPERIRGEPSGVSEDIYSLGCTLFEMLCGHAYRGMPPDFAQASGGPETQELPADELAEVPVVLRDILASLVAEAPLDRPASAREASQLLAGWLSQKTKARRRTWQVVLGIPLLFACALYAWMAYPRGDIAVLSGDGTVRTLCRTLAQAISVLQEGETLELRSDGPFSCASVMVSPKPLTIRAGPGFLPQIEFHRARSGALACYGTLDLDGLVIRYPGDEGSPAHSVVSCAGDSLRIMNCRFEFAGSAGGLTCLTATRTLVTDLQNNIFVGRGGVVLGWEPGDKGQVTMRNCLILGTTAVEYRASSVPQQQGNIRIEQCSLSGSHVLSVVPSSGNRFEFEPDVPLSVEAKTNAFRTSMSLVQFEGWPTDQDAAATIATHLDWRDQGNLHATDLDRTVIWRRPDSPPGTFRTDTLTAWTRHWGKSLEDVDAIFVLGGNVELFFGDKLRARVAHDFLRHAAERGKVLYGIGDGPAVLADAGLLKGRRATVQRRYQDKLKDHGALVVGDGIVRDGNIVTAESNFHIHGLVGDLPDKPLVLALIADEGFWFDDFRAAKFEVERIGGSLLTISTTVGTATPDKAGGGEPIVPDLLLPLLRFDGGANFSLGPDSWLSKDLSKFDLFASPVEPFSLRKTTAGQDPDSAVPGIDARTLGPRRALQQQLPGRP